METHSSYLAIILAAGASVRMGTCKASLPWVDGKTLLSYQAEQWLLAGFTPLVVLGLHNAERQNDCPPGCRVVINPNPSAGKTSSLLLGVRSLPRDFEILAISAVDQPRPTAVYQKLRQAHRHNAAIITSPSHNGQLGHPLMFSRKVLPHLENIHEETAGLRQVVRAFHAAIQKVEFDTPEVLSDLNTLKCYRNLGQASGKR